MTGHRGTEAQRIRFFVLLLFAALEIAAGAQSPVPVRPVHTFSIVARDPATGELGVAVQSHWFSGGPIGDRNWLTLTPRLVAAGQPPKDPMVLDRILKAAN